MSNKKLCVSQLEVKSADWFSFLTIVLITGKASLHQDNQSRLQALFCFQNGGAGRRNCCCEKAAKIHPKSWPWTILSLKIWWKVFVSFEQRFQITRKQTRLPIAETNLVKFHLIMCHVSKYSRMIGVFWHPCSGVPTPVPPFWKRRKHWGRGCQCLQAIN